MAQEKEGAPVFETDPTTGTVEKVDKKDRMKQAQENPEGWREQK